jgi:hypothetical protein
MNATIQTGINKLPPAIQALRDEIRTLDRYVRQGLLTQEEADCRLYEWGLAPVPGFYRYDRLALLGVWEDDYWKEEVLKHWESNEPKPTKPAKKEYRPAKSTVDAYRHLQREGDAERTEHWLQSHPKDAEYLRGLK